VAVVGRLSGLYWLFYSVDPFAYEPPLALNDRVPFNTWVGCLAWALALFDKNLSTTKRGLLVILVAAWTYYSFIISSSWVSGWLPMIVGCAVITFLRSKRFFLLGVVAGVIFLLLNFNYYWEHIVVAEEEEGSGSGRVELWERNLDHIVKHPLFGMGPAGYAVYNMSYHPEDARSTHNNYFDVTAQTGLIGLVSFFWMFIVFIQTGNKTRHLLAGRRNFEEAFANAGVGGAVAVLVAMMLGDWVLPFAYNQGIGSFDNASHTWLFIGCMISLYHIVKARQEEHPIQKPVFSPGPARTGEKTGFLQPVSAKVENHHAA
jgi:O-antigen ligase